MLNSTTKNRINTCRDILVGKIPDPKWQIDQITNALVYKFMDDQDRMSRELDYNAQFFTDDYEKYAWSKLFDTKLTNQDRANLYIEWLDRLSRADHLPDLFKQIFKDAYLPFRDANTIVMFLTEINWFDYHHSEELGNAFEYLLSIMGSQWDAGQFRTPRHIIEFLVDVVDPQKSETILDPACGTAGFLVEAFKHISAKWDIGVQDIAKLAESITGVDIDPGMAKIARVNLYLHGFKTPKITENDTLTNEKLWGTKYDVILANPPFMTPKGGIQPHDKFAIRANRAEVLFTDYIAEHLRLHGRAGIIVPEGIIFQSSNAYKDLRKMLVDGGYLWAVASLPAWCFNPYSGVKTTILFLDRDRAKQNDSILFVKIKNDGYDLGAQRREWGRNDLPKALEILNQYKENSSIDLENEPLAILVEKSRIAESGDYNLSGDRYIASTSPVSTEYEMVELGNVFDEIKNGKNVNQIDEIWNYKVSRIQTIAKWVIDLNAIKWTNDNVNDWDFLKENDILLSHINSIDHLWKTAIFNSLERVIHWANLLRLRSTSWKIIPKYWIYILKTRNFLNDVQRFAQKAVNQASINTTSLKSIQIPLPPIEVQEQIVVEFDGYQRIIDGARAVVENHKPMIKIDPEWEIVELGKVCENHDSKRRPVEKWERKEGIYPYYGASGIVDYVDNYIFDWEYLLISEDGANLLARSTPIAFSISWKNWVNNHAHILWFESHFTQKFIELYINSIDISLYVTWAAQPKLNQANLNSIKIPLPSLEIQQSIVEQIEEEQRLVDANRRLIEIYEGKIKDRMNEVWGV